MCMCVCTWLEQSRAPTGVPLLHLLCEYSLGGKGKVWRDLADQCWKICPLAVLVMHSQLLLTGMEDARIPGCSLACSTYKSWLLLCWVGDFPISCPGLRCSAKLAMLFLSSLPRRPVSTPSHPPSIQPAGNTAWALQLLHSQAGITHQPHYPHSRMAVSFWPKSSQTCAFISTFKHTIFT